MLWNSWTVFAIGLTLFMGCAKLWGPLGSRWSSALVASDDPELNQQLARTGITPADLLAFLHPAFPLTYSSHPGGEVNFLTRRMHLSHDTQTSRLSAFIRIAHETIHVRQGQRWPGYTRIQSMAGLGGTLAAMALGVALALHVEVVARLAAFLAIVGLGYHLPWHVRLETEAVLDTPALLDAFWNTMDPATLPADLRQSLQQKVLAYTQDTVLSYPPRATDGVLIAALLTAWSGLIVQIIQILFHV